MLIAVPTGIKVFNWMFTMWGGHIRFTTANLFAISFIPTFVMGGVTGVMLAVAPADFQFHDPILSWRTSTTSSSADCARAVLPACFYWWPKMFGRMLNERWANGRSGCSLSVSI